ncbi:FAD-dependent monooxygenase [Lutimaribacter marinistellae]|uniref:FAD-dependent monooxygenase n=1 Tax=Lutimaribacter marinistellae TaxID=1820329 RepID=A0ABV7TJX4_9RHOB
MEFSGRKIVVAGAGIGGLASALALRQRGAEVVVLEQADAIREVGAGLQISPNGVAVLRALGLERALKSISMASKAVVLRDFRAPGEVLRLDFNTQPEAEDYRLVHRADLVDLLADAVRRAGVNIRLLQKIDSVEDGQRAQVRMANGAEVEADLLVGADGLHSTSRIALNGADRPFFTGQVAWRALVPNTLGLPSEAQIFMGPGRHLVCYPLRNDTVVNIVAVQERREWAAEGWDHSDDPDNLREAFAGFEGTPRAILEQVIDVRLWGLFRHPVARRWHGQSVAILGDAAHPTLPFMAQGANLALEDAWVLADSLSGAATMRDGLRRYQSRRRERAERVIAAANGNAWKFHVRPAPVRKAGHIALRLAGALAPERMLRRFDWIYGHDVTAT